MLSVIYYEFLPGICQHLSQGSEMARKQDGESAALGGRALPALILLVCMTSGIMSEIRKRGSKKAAKGRRLHADVFRVAAFLD